LILNHEASKTTLILNHKNGIVLLQQGENLLPIEVKSGSTSGLKSLRFFLETHHRSPYGIRFLPDNFYIDNGIHNYPLYAAAKLVAPDSELFRSLLS
jgi:hypothetical protein